MGMHVESLNLGTEKTVLGVYELSSKGLAV